MSPESARVSLTDSFRFTEAGRVIERIWFLGKPELIGEHDLVLGKLRVGFSPTPSAIGLLCFHPGDPRLNLRGYAAGQLLFRVDAPYDAEADRPLCVQTSLAVVD